MAVRPNPNTRSGQGSQRPDLSTLLTGAEIRRRQQAMSSGGGATTGNAGTVSGGSMGGGRTTLPSLPSGLGGATGGTSAGVSAGAGASPLTITAAPSPDMAAATEAWKQRMAESKKALDARMSSDTTGRAMDRVATQARDLAAGMGAQADIQGAQTGRGPGYQAGSIGEAAQRYAAKGAADVALGREGQLDTLALGSQNSLNSLYGQNPYAQTAQLGLAQQGLGLDAWRAQQDAALRQQQLNQQQQQFNQQQQGSPLDWYRMLYGSGSI